MKKRNSLIALVLVLVLSLGTFQPVFAGAGLDTSKVGDEVNVETVSMDLYKDTVAGKYKLINTATLKRWQNKKVKMVIVDTMPEGWFAQRHIPGAINAFAPLKKPNTQENFTKKQFAAYEKALVKAVKKACKETVTVKDKKTGKKKKVTRVNYKKKVVVYCGFVKCTRSHVGAKALVKAGFKNVYRHPGGISAWIDAGNAIEGTDAAAAN